MKKRGKYIGIIVVISMLLFWYSHRSPESAVKTVVFSAGHFDESMHSTVEKVNDDLYVISPVPIENETLGELRTYQIKSYGFIYFAECYGEV